MDVTKHFKRTMRDFTCGQCGTQAGYDIKFAQAEWDDEFSPDFTSGKSFVVVQCHNCGLLTIFAFDMQSEEIPCRDEFALKEFFDRNPDVVNDHWDSEEGMLEYTWMEYQGQYPSGRKVSSAVPDDVRDALREASNCLAVGASDAAVLMSRCVIERLVSHLDEAQNRARLADALKSLKNKKIISEAMYRFLFEIKEWGNIIAHPKDRLPINLREAQKVVEFVFYGCR